MRDSLRPAAPRRRAGGPATRALALLTLVALVVSAAPARADEPGDSAARLHRLLSTWQIERVEAGLTALRARHGAVRELRVLEARLLHMRRDFAGAVAALEGLCLPDAPPADGRLCELVAGSERATRDFKAVPSSGGHFVLHYLPGPDEVLVPYADETLEAAYRELGALFRHFPDRPVHVDILPDVEGLAAMTPLTREEIETSGTIAMCKFDRLMIVSPRDLVYGYGWRDTLAHEYVHYLLTKRSHNRVPLWLHEGLAKYFEGRWRPDARPRLTPISEHILAEGLRKRRLIGLKKLYPSIAKLPSQDDAALAFAQVHTLIGWMLGRQGEEGLLRLLDRLTRGEPLDEALVGIYEMSFRKLERVWRRWLERQTFRRIPRAYRPRLLFRGRDRKEDELASIDEERARDLTYLGDLLRARGRHAAALVEYHKAVKTVGTSSPVLQAKMSAAELALARYSDALKTVGRVLQSYPGYVLLQLHRGEALLRLGRPAEALEALSAANDINPFDPHIHELLAETWTALGDGARAAFERRQHALVAGE